MAEVRRAAESALRIIVGIHLVAVGVCIIFARLDRSTIGLPPNDSLAGGAVDWLLCATFPVLLVCPVAVLAVALRRGLSWWVASALLVEVLFCLIQLMAISLANS
jgi:hypothetical protein